MNYINAFKRAIATFLFASTGILIGGALGDVDVWSTAGWVGLGAVINYVYRASQAYLEVEV